MCLSGGLCQCCGLLSIWQSPRSSSEMRDIHTWRGREQVRIPSWRGSFAHTPLLPPLCPAHGEPCPN